MQAFLSLEGRLRLNEAAPEGMTITKINQHSNNHGLREAGNWQSLEARHTANS